MKPVTPNGQPGDAEPETHLYVTQLRRDKLHALNVLEEVVNALDKLWAVTPCASFTIAAQVTAARNRARHVLAGFQHEVELTEVRR